MSCSCSLQPWGLWGGAAWDEGKASWSGGFHVCGGEESLKTPPFSCTAVEPFDFGGCIATWWETNKQTNISEYTLQLSVLRDSVLTSGTEFPGNVFKGR